MLELATAVASAPFAAGYMPADAAAVVAASLAEYSVAVVEHCPGLH